MTHDQVRAVLAGESPYVDVGAHLATCAECSAYQASLDAVDDLARALPPTAVPSHLVAATLQAMDQEIAHPVIPLPTRRRDLWASLATGVALAAVALLFLVPRERGPGDVEGMIEKGIDGPAAPEIDLKVAVVPASGGGAVRFNRERTYQVGDRIEFRAEATTDAVRLLRIQDEGVMRITLGNLAGTDGYVQLAWALEAHDDGSAFIWLTSAMPFEEAQLVAVEASLQAAYDGVDTTRICQVATELGVGCAGILVHVQTGGEER